MIVRGAFSKLFVPGLRQQFLSLPIAIYENVEVEIEAAEQMAIVHPDTSKAPVWRKPPRRLESPIVAYRAWEVEATDEGYKLCSVAVHHLWDGPVVRADMRPVDPSIWDAGKKAMKEGKKAYDEYYGEMSHTFSTAGIWAVKTYQQVLDVSRMYYAPAYGEVALWGRVAQFKLGYRAELCMIKKIFIDTIFTDYIGGLDTEPWTKWAKAATKVARNFERRYDCEVMFVRDGMNPSPMPILNG